MLVMIQQSLASGGGLSSRPIGVIHFEMCPVHQNRCS